GSHEQRQPKETQSSLVFPIGQPESCIEHIGFSFEVELMDLSFEGYPQGNKDELTRISGLRQGMFLDPFVNEHARQLILEHYHEKGYHQDEVRLTRGEKPGDNCVCFQITVGPKVQIEDPRSAANNKADVNHSSRGFFVDVEELFPNVGSLLNGVG